MSNSKRTVLYYNFLATHCVIPEAMKGCPESTFPIYHSDSDLSGEESLCFKFHFSLSSPLSFSSVYGSFPPETAGKKKRTMSWKEKRKMFVQEQRFLMNACFVFYNWWATPVSPFILRHSAPRRMVLFAVSDRLGRKLVRGSINREMMLSVISRRDKDRRNNKHSLSLPRGEHRWEAWASRRLPMLYPTGELPSPHTLGGLNNGRSKTSSCENPPPFLLRPQWLPWPQEKRPFSGRSPSLAEEPAEEPWEDEYFGLME